MDDSEVDLLKFSETLFDEKGPSRIVFELNAVEENGVSAVPVVADVFECLLTLFIIGIVRLDCKMDEDTIVLDTRTIQTYFDRIGVNIKMRLSADADAGAITNNIHCNITYDPSSGRILIEKLAVHLPVHNLSDIVASYDIGSKKVLISFSPVHNIDENFCNRL